MPTSAGVPVMDCTDIDVDEEAVDVTATTGVDGVYPTSALFLLSREASSLERDGQLICSDVCYRYIALSYNVFHNNNFNLLYSFVL
jgi:hypothetical protein